MPNKISWGLMGAKSPSQKMPLDFNSSLSSPHRAKPMKRR